jgi:hypothetical protein
MQFSLTNALKASLSKFLFDEFPTKCVSDREIRINKLSPRRVSNVGQDVDEQPTIVVLDVDMRDDTESCSLEANALSFGDSSHDLFELNDTEELHANDANSSRIKDHQREIVQEMKAL